MRKSVMTLLLGGILLLPPTFLPASSGNDSKLYDAPLYADIPAMEQLLKKSANPNLKTEAGDIPLASAIYEPEVLALMLAAGADPNIRNRHGESVLFYAIANGTPGDVKALIDAGADVNLKNSDGQTPLQRADAQVKEETTVLLIEHGATRSGEAGNKEVTAEPASQTVVSTSPTGGMLAGFPVISVTKMVTESGATLFYFSSASLPDVLDFYATELDRLGFEKGFEFTDKQTYLSSKYTLDGGAYSLSLGKDTSGNAPLVMVTINAHGKQRANQLPRIANSEPLYEEDHISIYVVDDAPKAAAKKTLALLNENGWQGDISVDTDTVQTINLDKGDTTLSIMVSVAPAQNNRTTIQYNLMLKN
jgi:ankyrin repeat protein